MIEVFASPAHAKRAFILAPLCGALTIPLVNAIWKVLAHQLPKFDILFYVQYSLNSMSFNLLTLMDVIILFFTSFLMIFHTLISFHALNYRNLAIWGAITGIFGAILIHLVIITTVPNAKAMFRDMGYRLPEFFSDDMVKEILMGLVCGLVAASVFWWLGGIRANRK